VIDRAGAAPMSSSGPRSVAPAITLLFVYGWLKQGFANEHVRTSA
jgi:hypothetical protein